MLVKLEDQWHTATGTYPDGSRWTVETVCGLRAEWDHVSVDALPDGGDPHCVAGGQPAESTPDPAPPEEEEPAVPKARKRK